MKGIKLFFTLFLLVQVSLTTGEVFAQDSIPESTAEYRIIKPYSSSIPNYSGDNQHQSIGLKIEKPLRVQVLDELDRPVANHPVYFEKIASPKDVDKFKIHNKVVYTDSNGISENFITLGSKKGYYEILAKIKGADNGNFLIYKYHARKSNWVFMLVIGLLGGLCLFLLGMNMMSEGMKRSAGDKMRSILSKLTHNRIVAVGVGTFVTMVIQSSSATTVMLVSFVQSNLMRFSQTIGIILGAAIGTTITTQLIAFKLSDYSLLIIALGFGIQTFSKSNKYKFIGQALLGFGVLFFGMHVMSEAMYPLRSYEPFIESLVTLENPMIAILVGAVFTALIQSSSAFIGIMIILSTQGFLTLESSIGLVLGSNLGTAITAILASLNANREAKKVALAHTLIKVLGILIFVWWIPYFAEIVLSFTPKALLDSSNLYVAQPRQIANVHTIFNVALTLLILPFTNGFSKLIHKILPKKEILAPEPFKLKYLDNHIIHTPALALSLAKQETIRMSRIVQEMLNDVLQPYIFKDAEKIKIIEEKEEKINFLRDNIKAYLLKITHNSQESRVQEAFQIIYTVKEFERIADIISKTLCQKAKKWVNSDNKFSPQGEKEILDYHTRSMKQISRAIEVFRDVNLEKAEAMKRKYKKYRTIAIELEKHHYERLQQEVEESILSSKTHLEIIGLLREVSSHATNIARILIEWSEQKD